MVRLCSTSESRPAKVWVMTARQRSSEHSFSSSGKLVRSHAPTTSQSMQVPSLGCAVPRAIICPHGLAALWHESFFPEPVKSRSWRICDRFKALGTRGRNLQNEGRKNAVRQPWSAAQDAEADVRRLTKRIVCYTTANNSFRRRRLIQEDCMAVSSYSTSLYLAAYYCQISFDQAMPSESQFLSNRPFICPVIHFGLHIELISIFNFKTTLVIRRRYNCPGPRP